MCMLSSSTSRYSRVRASVWGEGKREVCMNTIKLMIKKKQKNISFNLSSTLELTCTKQISTYRHENGIIAWPSSASGGIGLSKWKEHYQKWGRDYSNKSALAAYKRSMEIEKNRNMKNKFSFDVSCVKREWFKCIKNVHFDGVIPFFTRSVSSGALCRTPVEVSICNVKRPASPPRF